jgi:hypothetical protein
LHDYQIAKEVLVLEEVHSLLFRIAQAGGLMFECGVTWRLGEIK